MRIPFIAAFLVGVVIMTSCSSVTQTDMDKKVLSLEIKTEKTFQTMHHFGASAAWWAQEVGSWSDDSINEIMDLLYNDQKGIGLDVIRYNLGGGKERTILTDPLRSAHTIEISSGVYDHTKDAHAVRIIDEAVARGASVIVFANSPPSRLTVTGAPTGSGYKTNLANGKEEEFARYLVGCAEYLQKERDWPIMEISPINEPQWDWAPYKGQEGCYYSPDEAAAVVKALHEVIVEKQVPYGISAIDSAEIKVAANAPYLSELFATQEPNAPLPHYAVHSYWSSAFDKENLRHYMDRKFPDTEIWMTEWTQMESGRDYGMDSAIRLSQTIWEDCSILKVSSWQYWIALSPYDYHDGLIYFDSSNRTIIPTKRLWAMGNWSRFITSGAKMVSVETGKENMPLLASAWINPDDSLVCVLTNGTDAEFTIDLVENGTSHSKMEVYTTSDEHDLALTASGLRNQITVGARSITTIVLRQAD
jgi:O-glycosyl hydrolase